MTVQAAPGLDPATVAAQFPILSRVDDGKPLVYLDSAATAQNAAKSPLFIKSSPSVPPSIPHPFLISRLTVW